MEKKLILFRKKIIRFIGFSLCLLLFAFSFSDRMTAYRTSGGVVFAESSALPQEMLEKLFSYSSKNQRFDASVTVSGSSDERMEKIEPLPRFFRFFAYESISVYNDERALLYPCGDAVGISIHSDGVLVVGFGEITDRNGKKVCPAKDCGLRAGDIIRSVDGRTVCTTDELRLALNASMQNEVEIEVIRNGKSVRLGVEPAYERGGEARIGCWVRDSTVGIGTLSFIAHADGRTAALGHAVIDQDTSTLLPVLNGSMVFADILGVSKGNSGTPGELKGTFSSKSAAIGSILSNNELGIYGKLDSEAYALFAEREALPIAFPNEVHTGDAYILSQTDSGQPQSYSCRIIRAAKQKSPEQKGLVIEITDKRLLDATGGIVRGMSGSPIIQDGMVAGVVTHVFVNDPSKGYGVYAFWMYENSG